MARGQWRYSISGRHDPVLQGPHHLGVIQQSTCASNLITEIQKAVTTDSYLSGVLQSVMDSDDNLFETSSWMCVRHWVTNGVEDVRPRVCEPAVCERPSSVQLMGTAH